MDSYLKERGLYPSTTYLYLRSQHKDTTFAEAGDIRCKQDREYETSRIADGGSPCSTGDPPPLTLDHTSSSSTALLSNPGTVEGIHVVC